MTTQFSPPPTYAEVLIIDKDLKALPRFNPIWLKWFLDVAQLLTTAGGGGGGGFAHNSLTGIQGGAPGDYWHFTGAQHTDVLAFPGDLADEVNPAKGAALVGYNGGTVADALGTLESRSQLLWEETVTVACTSVTATGLDLQAARGFYIEASKDDSTTCSISVGVNGNTSTSDYQNQYIYGTNTTLSGLRQTDRMFLVYSVAGAEGYGWGTMNMTPSGIVVMNALMARGLSTGGGTIDGGVFLSQSLFTVANVTEITFEADAANGIGVGTTFRIYSKR